MWQVTIKTPPTASTYPAGFFPRKFAHKADAESLRDEVARMGGAAEVVKGSRRPEAAAPATPAAPYSPAAAVAAAIMAGRLDPLVAPEAWAAGQTWHYRATYLAYGLPVRVAVRLDMHRPQSWAKAEVYSRADCRWNTLAWRDGELCREAGRAADEKAYFSADEEAVLGEACAVLAAAHAGG